MAQNLFPAASAAARSNFQQQGVMSACESNGRGAPRPIVLADCTLTGRHNEVPATNSGPLAKRARKEAI